MAFKITFKEPLTVRRAKLLILVPLMVIGLPVVILAAGISEMWPDIKRLPQDIKRAWRKQQKL